MRTYAEWVASGKVWYPALPIVAMHTALTPLGGVIGVLGNRAHLLAVPPQDHCPYSATGAPAPNPYPYVCALDYSGPRWESLRDYWINAARHGYMPWVKYINDGISREYNFLRGDVTPNSDRDHCHTSIRSDWVHKSVPSGFVFVPPTGIALGARGMYVLVVQAVVGVNRDGEFGPVTDNAVRKFQMRYGLAVDGVFGPASWRTAA